MVIAEAGLLDTNIVILRPWIRQQLLPERLAISAITLAELSAGVHLTVDPAERARRIAVLQRAEAEFDPIPFDAEAARVYGQISAAVVQIGRTPRRRVADLMIASVATLHGVPVVTTNPDDYRGLDGLVDVIAVPRPPTPAQQP